MTERGVRTGRVLLAGPAGALALVGTGVARTDVTTGEIIRTLVLLAWAAAAAGLMHRRPSEPLGLRLALVTAAAGLGHVAAILERHGDLGDGGSDGAALIARLALGLLIPAGAWLLLALPNGRLHSPGSRNLLIGSGAIGVLVGVVAFVDRPEVPWWLVALAAVGLGGGALILANQSYRQARSADQRRYQWVGLALVLIVEAVLVVGALDLVIGWPRHTDEIAGAASLLAPVALLAGVSPRLGTRIDRLLAGTVSLAGLTAVITTGYLLVVVGFGRRPEEGDRAVLVVSMIGAAVAASIYVPLRDRLIGAANELVYGDRSSPDESLRTFGMRMTRAIPMDELLLQLVESLRKTMRLASAEVWTGEDGTYDIAAGVPHRENPPLFVAEKERAVVARAGVSGGTWLDVWLAGLVDGRDSSLLRVAPLAHAGALLGVIVMERREGGEPFGEDDDATVAELARQVALALHNVQLDSALQASLTELQATNDQLVESRARIVAAGDAERRKLERNLHDGAQQHLVAMAVKLRLAHDAIEDDPADALGLLDELGADVKDAIAELRALAHGIFPPLLVSGGLAEALPSAAGRAALPVTVDLDGVGRYAQDREAAIYFCVLEALQNAGKHAGDGAAATVRVWEEGNTVGFEVADDGVGFAQDRSAPLGHGFVNMADRLGAYGGQLTVASAPGRGARVTGTVPL